MNRCKPLRIVAKPTQAIYSANNIKEKGPESCCIVSDSLGHARLLLSSITGFVISKITQRNFTNQNVNLGLYLAVLPYKHDLLIFNGCGLNYFVLSKAAKYCSALKQPKMRGNWKRVSVKLFCIDLNPPNPDLNYK